MTVLVRVRVGMEMGAAIAVHDVWGLVEGVLVLVLVLVLMLVHVRVWVRVVVSLIGIRLIWAGQKRRRREG